MHCQVITLHAAPALQPASTDHCFPQELVAWPQHAFRHARRVRATAALKPASPRRAQLGLVAAAPCVVACRSQETQTTQAATRGAGGRREQVGDHKELLQLHQEPLLGRRDRRWWLQYRTPLALLAPR